MVEGSVGRTVSPGLARGVHRWCGSRAWVMGGSVCGYNTGPTGITVYNSNILLSQQS